MVDFPYDALTMRLASEEGKKAYVYDDATGLPIKPGSTCHGHPTIGIGRALDVHGLSDDEVKYLLRNDIVAIVNQLSKFLWFSSANANRQMALADMCFQIGYAGFLAFSEMIASIRAGNWALAKEQALNSRWATEAPARAKRVTDLFVLPDIV